MTATFYWHDYETWGINPALDRPAQFAGLRTDMDLNPVGEPLVMYCQPAADVLPDPQSCLITGITPQQAQAEGVPEYEFIRRIHQELAQPGTCGVGYNSLRFDDEFTRFTLYRNFYDAYAREWQNGNSRWDLIDAVRLAGALRPEGLQWPMVDGVPSYRLEALTAANGIEHAGAHDALVDVKATIALARKLKAAQPKLWQWVLDNRSKHAVGAMLEPAKAKPVLHVSSRFGSERYCMAMVLPLAWHVSNKNSVIVYDLSVDPEPLLSLRVEDIRTRVFTARNELPDGVDRIPLKQVHINKAPVVVPTSLLDAQAQARTGIDPEVCERHTQKLLLQAKAVATKVREVFAHSDFAPITDPEAMLYSGGFFNDHDRRLMDDIRSMPAEQLAAQSFAFADERLETLLLRYRARNFPHTLSAEEQQQWQHWCRARLNDPAAGGVRVISQVREQLAELRTRDKTNTAILDALTQWVDARAGVDA
ncbi:MAG TPA: exodeoxyribonuclease I [Pseudomonadales bacterium]